MDVESVADDLNGHGAGCERDRIGEQEALEVGAEGALVAYDLGLEFVEAADCELQHVEVVDHNLPDHPAEVAHQPKTLLDPRHHAVLAVLEEKIRG